MRAILKLELIGYDYFLYKRDNAAGTGRHSEHMERRGERLGFDKKQVWVARLLSYDGLNFEREFVNGQRDYSQASGSGARGVFCYYALTPGIYEVHDRPVWRRTERYFIKVEGTEIVRISKDEAIKLLPNPDLIWVLK